MYAVVQIAGQQFKVKASEKLYVPKLNSDVGTKLTFDKVLVVGDDKKTTVGKPFVAGAKVQATVVQHVKDDTVIVLKKKKRKGYRVRNGHRQQFTQIEINSLA
jgi:large subunit ribosomal protein L21